MNSVEYFKSLRNPDLKIVAPLPRKVKISINKATVLYKLNRRVLSAVGGVAWDLTFLVSIM